MIVGGNRCSGVVTLTAESRRERRALERTVHAEPWQWQGDTLVVEARFANVIVDALSDAGVEVK